MALRPAKLPDLAVADPRLDAKRCLLTVGIASAAPRRVEVAVLALDERGRFVGSARFPAGPIPKGTSRQVLLRVSSSTCTQPPARIRAYPNFTPRHIG